MPKGKEKPKEEIVYTLSIKKAPNNRLICESTVGNIKYKVLKRAIKNQLKALKEKKKSINLNFKEGFELLDNN